MSDLPEKPRLVRGQILPPVPSYSQPPAAPFGIPFLAVMRNRALTRQFDSFTEIEEAANRHLDALHRQRGLQLQLNARNNQLYAELGESELLRQKEVDKVRDEVAKYYKDSKKQALVDDTEIAILELRLKQARAALADPQTPAKTTPKPTAADNLKRLFAEIREVEQVFGDYIDGIIASANGEEHLTEDARQHLENMRLLKTDKIQTLYESAR